MEVNISDLNLGDITESFLRDECIKRGQELGVDTSQGSIYRDVCEGHIIRTAKFFSDMNKISRIISMNTCTGDVLDEKLREKALERNPPANTPATYYVEFVGAEPEVGDIMSCNDHFGRAIKVEGRWAFQTDDTGTEMNGLVPGIPVIPERDVDDLISATLQDLAIPAVDIEDDDSARERYLNYISGPSENGNRSQMKSWCEAITGVGRARIVSKWNGPNTVLGIIISTEGVVPEKAIIENVQEIIDPGAEGMGEGKATIGCHFTAKAAQETKINITVDITKKSASSYVVLEDAIKESLRRFLKEMVLHSDSESLVIRYNSIGALITGIEDVVDYSNLLLNGGTDNISCDQYHIPVVGEVIAHGDI